MMEGNGSGLMEAEEALHAALNELFQEHVDDRLGAVTLTITLLDPEIGANSA